MFRERGGSGIEFKYRAVDEQAAWHPQLPPSSYSYFTEQAIRAGYIAPGLERIHENFQNPVLTREAIQRELEKEKIRDEIIATEIARRRDLEDEGRREMMLERELARRGRQGSGSERFSFLPGAGMGTSLEERIIMSLEERLRNGTRHEIGGSEIVSFEGRSVEPKIGRPEMIPFQQTAVEPKIAEITPTSEFSKRQRENCFSGKENGCLTMDSNDKHLSKGFKLSSESQGSLFSGGSLLYYRPNLFGLFLEVIIQ